MPFIFYFTILALSFGEVVHIYDDGLLENGFRIYDPYDLGVTCVRKNDDDWIGSYIDQGKFIVLSNNNTLPTKVRNENDKYYKTIKFTARYDNDNVDNLPLNVKVFSKDFNNIYNTDQINSVEGYTVKLEKNKDNHISVLLNNFNLDSEIGSVLFTRATHDDNQDIRLLFNDIRFDTDGSESRSYNGATGIFSSLLLAFILALFI